MNYREEDKLIYDIIMSLQDRQQATQKALSSSINTAASGSASAAQGQRSPAAAGSAAQRQQRGGESKSRSGAAVPGSPDSTTGYVEQLHFYHLCVWLSVV